MPSDAKILREQGREALRAYWREKERRKWGRLPIEKRHAIWRVKRECYLEAHPELRRYRVGPAPRYCARCSTQIQRLRDRKYPKYCSPECQRAAVHERSLIGKACSMGVQLCRWCRDPFTHRGARPINYCSAECRKASHVAYNRETQRRTHSIAKRYWTVDNSPDAHALADTYFQLRQTLRRHRNGDPF